MPNLYRITEVDKRYDKTQHIVIYNENNHDILINVLQSASIIKILILITKLREKMTEEEKKHYDLYKYLTFPWGAIAATSLWGVIFKFIKDISTFTTESGEVIGVPWWYSLVLFVIGEIVIFLFLAIYSYYLPRGKKQDIIFLF